MGGAFAGLSTSWNAVIAKIPSPTTLPAATPSARLWSGANAWGTGLPRPWSGSSSERESVFIDSRFGIDGSVSTVDSSTTTDSAFARRESVTGTDLVSTRRHRRHGSQRPLFGVEIDVDTRNCAQRAFHILTRPSSPQR